MQKKWYVSMTDRFMSGWGGAKGRIAKYVVVCDSFEEAEIAADNARRRSEMRYVNICVNCPRYDSRRYQTSFLTKEKNPNSPWYIPSPFQRNEG